MINSHDTYITSNTNIISEWVTHLNAKRIALKLVKENTRKTWSLGIRQKCLR